MKLKTILISFGLLLLSNSHVNAFSDVWSSSYTGTSYSGMTSVTSTSNTYICGTTSNTTNGMDGFIQKYNSGGTLMWTTLYNSTRSGMNADDVFNGIAIDASSNIYVVGGSYDNKFSTNAFDMVIAKYSEAGTLSWMQTYNSGAINSNEEAFSVAVDTLNNVWVCGVDRGRYGLMRKYDPTGTLLFANSIDYTNGKGYNKFNAVDVDTNSAVYVTGYFKNSPKTQPLLFVSKYDTSGTFVWISTYNALYAISSISTNTYTRVSNTVATWVEGTGVAIDSSGHVNVTGFQAKPEYHQPPLVISSKTIYVDGMFIDNALLIQQYLPNNGLLNWTTTYMVGFSTIPFIRTSTAPYKLQDVEPTSNLSFTGTGIAHDSSSNLFTVGWEYRPDLRQAQNVLLLKWTNSGMLSDTTSYATVVSTTVTSTWDINEAGTAVAVDSSGRCDITGWQQFNSIIRGIIRKLQ